MTTCGRQWSVVQEGLLDALHVPGKEGGPAPHDG